MNDLFEYGDILNSPFEAFSGQWKTIKPHWHYFTEIIYVVSGTMTTETPEKTYISNPGDFIILSPKLIHSFSSEPKDGKDFLCYCIKFDSSLLRNTIPGTPKISKVLEASDHSDKVEISLPSSRLKDIPMKAYFETCLQEVHEREFGYDIKINALLSLMLTNVIRIWQENGFDPYENPTVDQFSTKEFSVLEYIDAHSSEALNIEKLAQMCGMCYSNFAKQFKAQYGKTCKEYIEFVRICKADTMLLYTNYTLDYISQETGFTDASHFIRIYKKIRGITPKQRRAVSNNGLK